MICVLLGLCFYILFAVIGNGESVLAASYVKQNNMFSSKG